MTSRYLLSGTPVRLGEEPKCFEPLLVLCDGLLGKVSMARGTVGRVHFSHVTSSPFPLKQENVT